jgi:hypothetical protein
MESEIAIGLQNQGRIRFQIERQTIIHLTWMPGIFTGKC